MNRSRALSSLHYSLEPSAMSCGVKSLMLPSLTVSGTVLTPNMKAACQPSAKEALPPDLAITRDVASGGCWNI